MRRSPDIRGIVTVLNTPFRPDDTLDLDGLRSNVEYAVNAGVAGFLVNGLAAEVEYLSPAERETIADVTVRNANDLPVIAGLGGANEPHAVDHAERYLDIGCRGLLVNGAGVPNQALEICLARLDALKPPILMLQDWDASGSGIPVNQLLKLVEQYPSLRWLKIEVAFAGPKYSELIEHGPADLGVAGGWAVREMIDGLDRGVHVFMPTALHRTYVRIHALHAAGRQDESRALFERVKPVLDFSNTSLEHSVAFFKRLLHAQGYFASDWCRLPGVRLHNDRSAQANTLIKIAMALESAADAE